MSEERKEGSTNHDNEESKWAPVFGGACALSCALVMLLVAVGLVWKFTKWAFF